jgi:tetratricopeptide (TPR) repeat protein
MRKALSFALAALLACLATGAALAQHGGDQGNGGKGSSDSGGEQPFGGNVFRQDERNQLLEPEGSSPYQTGLHLLQDQKYRDAIPHLSAAVARSPNDAGAWFYLGYAHQELADGLPEAQRDDEVDAAMRAYRRALSLDPDIKSAHQYLGLLYLQKHSPDSAANQASSLARICPSGCDERAALDAAIAKYQPAASGQH